MRIQKRNAQKHQRHYPYLCAKGRQQRSQRLCRRFLGKRLGISPTARLNFNDPKMVAGLVQGIAAMGAWGEKGFLWAMTRPFAAARAVASGQMPKVVGRAPAKWEAARTQAGNTRGHNPGQTPFPGFRRKR